MTNDHVLFKPGDPDIPSSLWRYINEGGLSVCRVCGKAEIELSEPCETPDQKRDREAQLRHA